MNTEIRLGPHKNALGEVREVITVTNFGKANEAVWWKVPGKDGEHWDPTVKWHKWMRGDG